VSLRAVPITDPTGDRFCASLAGRSLNAALVRDQAPDASWLFDDAAGQLCGRCSIWWRNAPAHQQQRVGVIGHYAALSRETGEELLQHACTALRSEGCTLAVGPMDANTWYSYRLIVERGTEPIFFLELDHPDDWPDHFRAAGFTEIADYTSAVRSHLPPEDSRLARLEALSRDKGIHIRPIALEEFDAELDRLYQLSAISFAQNLFYAPIEREPFMRLYQGVRDVLHPQLVLLALRGDETRGFVFALPDLLQAQRGETVDTAIVKTLAVHPDESGWGLGSLLVDRCHQAAHELGYRRAIHALMQVENRSRRISQHGASTIRRYALFGQSLSAAR